MQGITRVRKSSRNWHGSVRVGFDVANREVCLSYEIGKPPPRTADLSTPAQFTWRQKHRLIVWVGKIFGKRSIESKEFGGEFSVQVLWHLSGNDAEEELTPPEVLERRLAHA